MTNKLKRRFVITSTLISFIVISVIIFFINVSNYNAFLKNSSTYLKQFINNNEIKEKKFIIKTDTGIYIINYEKLSKKNFHKNEHHFNHLRHRKEIIDIVSYILELNSIEGVYKKYRFYNDTNNKLIYLVDVHRDYNFFYKTFKNSLIILVLSVFSVFLLSYFFSSYAIKPIVKSQEKQKKFITNASHELKTPLSIILSNIEILEYDIVGNKYLNNAKDATYRLMFLVEELISLSRMEEVDDLTCYKFNLTKTAMKSASHYEPIFEKKCCPFEVLIDENINIKANKEQIVKVINIMLDNCGKYAKPNTKVKFIVTKNHRQILIKTINYCDNIKARSYNEIFDRFNRIDEHRNSNLGGYGVGLSILKSIVENHKGNVNAVSNDGETLEIDVNIPL